MGSNGRLVVVSNRIPEVEPPGEDSDSRETPVGGLVTTLRAALEERGGLWFGWSGRVAESGASPVPTISNIGPIQVTGIDLFRSEATLFYSDFSNRTLWPLLHSMPSKMSIRSDAYRAYVRANGRYADAIAPVLRDGDMVWVHDYLLLPLGSELRRLGWRGKIGCFLHTPFPAAEVFAVLPWARQLLEMLLDYDLFGLQTRRYLRNFVDSLLTELPGVVLGDLFVCGQQSLKVKTYPVGIDPDAVQRMASEQSGTSTTRFLKRLAARYRIILGVDRLDYTKGVVQRLLTYEHLLEHYPALRGRVTMIQISAPSRSRVPEYIEEKQQVDQLVGRINGRFSEGDWVPLRYLYRSHPQSELMAFYREADVCLITPLRDGMNLVVKEFVAAQGDDPGVAVLSRFCGAADTMPQAVVVNPYDIRGTGEAVYQALRMPKAERVRRWNALMQDIRSSTAMAWSDSFLTDLAES